MSQSTIAGLGTRSYGRPSTDPAVVDSDADVDRLLDVLDDADCRAILEATSDRALSASELSDRCDVPLSTVYRKLDLLTDTGLLAERTRLRESGKHASEYARQIEDVTVSVSADDGIEVTVTPCDQQRQSLDALIGQAD